MRLVQASVAFEAATEFVDVCEAFDALDILINHLLSNTALQILIREQVQFAIDMSHQAPFERHLLCVQTHLYRLS